jgi:hypothetical protein
MTLLILGKLQRIKRVMRQASATRVSGGLKIHLNSSAYADGTDYAMIAR